MNYFLGNLKRKIVLFVSMNLLLSCSLFCSLNAAMPNALNIQGRLTDGVGVNKPDGQYNIIFKIYDANIEGNLIWSEENQVTCKNGVFQVNLGNSSTALRDSIINTNGDLWLETTIKHSDNSTEVLVPRQKLLGTGYAFHAYSADLSTGDFTVGGNILINGEAKSVKNGQEFYMVPKGAIIMWSGSVNNIPEGWALCDGEEHTYNGVPTTTPNLENRFVIGSNNASGTPKTDILGTSNQTGGYSTVMLDISQIPSHSHGITQYEAGGHSHTLFGSQSYTSAYGFSVTLCGNGQGHTADSPTISSVGNHTHNVSCNSAGGGQAHCNVPPYFALAFIMKL
ncbi:MAG: hypothetical protein ABII64_02570 [Elusimicrobiota bacterium]